jgi:choline transport protein
MAACISDTVGDVASVLATPTGYPFIQVFYNATLSKGGATAMTSIMIVLSTANGMTNMATASRQLFAFARDRGVPFSDWFQKVPAGWDIPLNGEYQTSVRSALMLEMICSEI